MHHMLMSTRVIKDERYREVVHRLQKVMRRTVQEASSDENKETRLNPEVVDELYKEYMNDLKRKYL